MLVCKCQIYTYDFSFFTYIKAGGSSISSSRSCFPGAGRAAQGFACHSRTWTCTGRRTFDNTRTGNNSSSTTSINSFLCFHKLIVQMVSYIMGKDFFSFCFNHLPTVSFHRETQKLQISYFVMFVHIKTLQPLGGVEILPSRVS